VHCPLNKNCFLFVEILRTFALTSSLANFCIDQSSNGLDAVLNADAVYVTAFSALHLAFKLKKLGYFTSKEKSLPVSEVYVLATWVFVYLCQLR
jgi:hypothetical protein